MAEGKIDWTMLILPIRATSFEDEHTASLEASVLNYVKRPLHAQRWALLVIDAHISERAG